MRKLFLSALVVLISAIAVAQSVNILSMARAELEKRGLAEADVRARLLSEGINVDTIPPRDYPKYQGRVLALLDKMQEEKITGVSASPSVYAVQATDISESDMDTLSTRRLNVVDVVRLPYSKAPQTTESEAAAEKALQEALEKNNVSPMDGSDIYGHAMFAGQSMSVFRTTDGAQAPDTYVLGEGDEVHISIFGSSQAEIHQRIAVDGSIHPVGATKIFLKGLTLKDARALIRSRLSQHYSFHPDQISVIITTARTISVSVYGEVGVQGGFAMSALNNAFNALAAAGGPTAIGSIREIRLSRAGEVKTLDLYEYMLNPTSAFPYDLHNHDVLFVPIAKKVVEVEGAVNRPMKYEMRDGETLTDLIRYAGGLTYNAYPEFVQIQRYENAQISYLEYSLADVLSGKSKVNLCAGDIIKISAASRPMENYVKIGGDVYYGGGYDLVKNKSLRGLIEKAQPRNSARRDYVFVERTNPDETMQVLTVPYPGENGSPDFMLQARDSVTVLSLESYLDVDTLSVNGEVREPFSRKFNINDRMTVAQAIDYAHGLKPNVYPVAYIFRKDLAHPESMQYIRVDLENDGDVLLQPGDALNVYDNTTYSNVGEVRISGAVKNTVGATYDASLTLHDLIMMAGGFTLGAAFDRVEVFRMNVSQTEEVKYKIITLTVDENYYPSDKNFVLQPYDHVVVRLTPNFATDRTVELNGRVKYPGIYVLNDARTHLSEIIELAGGLLEDADPYTSIFRTFKERGRIGIDLNRMSAHRKKMESDPILMSGDVININRQENTVVIRTTGTRMKQYLPEDFSMEQKNVVYQGPHRAAWYIRHYAGGFDKYADHRSVTVTLPNNQTIGTKTFIFRATPRVQPGSVITLSMDQDKIDDHKRKKEEPKNKADLESIAAKALSSVTSIASIIILSRNLLIYSNNK